MSSGLGARGMRREWKKGEREGDTKNVEGAVVKPVRVKGKGCTVLK